MHCPIHITLIVITIFVVIVIITCILQIPFHLHTHLRINFTKPPAKSLFSRVFLKITMSAGCASQSMGESPLSACNAGVSGHTIVPASSAGHRVLACRCMFESPANFVGLGVSPWATKGGRLCTGMADEARSKIIPTAGCPAGREGGRGFESPFREAARTARTARLSIASIDQ